MMKSNEALPAVSPSKPVLSGENGTVKQEVYQIYKPHQTAFTQHLY